MAAASQRKYLTVKLRFLEEHRDQLLSCLNDQVDKVLQLGRSWVKGQRENEEGKTLSYKEISDSIDNMDMMVQQCAQLTGDDEDIPVSQTSTTDTTTSTSHVTGAANQTSADAETLTSVIARIQKIEEAFSSVSLSVDKQQVDLDFDTLKDHVEGEMTKTLEDVAEKVMKHEKSGKRINKLEQRIGALEERETQNVEKLEIIEKKLARQKIKQENLEDVEKQREEKLKAVEKKLDQIETSNVSLSSKVEDQESSIQELTTKVETHSTALETQRSSIQELTETIGTHSVSLENHTSSIQELTITTERHSTTLKDITSNRETEATKLTRVQNKLRVLKREKNTALKNVGKQLEEVTLNYQMVCKIVADRLVPLERLREILNEKAKKSDDNVERLNTVMQDVADLVPKVSHLENQNKQTITPTVAVMAGVVHITPVKGNIIDKWTCGAGNTSGHFDVNTGIFTAPVAGTYAVALCMGQWNEGKIGLSIRKTSSGRNPHVDSDMAMAVAISDRHDSTNCDFNVVNMSVGDKFCVRVWHVDKSPILRYCRFSIFLVK